MATTIALRNNNTNPPAPAPATSTSTTTLPTASSAIIVTAATTTNSNHPPSHYPLSLPLPPPLIHDHLPQPSPSSLATTTTTLVNDEHHHRNQPPLLRTSRTDPSIPISPLPLIHATTATQRAVIHNQLPFNRRLSHPHSPHAQLHHLPQPISDAVPTTSSVAAVPHAKGRQRPHLSRERSLIAKRLRPANLNQPHNTTAEQVTATSTNTTNLCAVPPQHQINNIHNITTPSQLYDKTDEHDLLTLTACSHLQQPSSFTASTSCSSSIYSSSCSSYSSNLSEFITTTHNHHPNSNIINSNNHNHCTTANSKPRRRKQQQQQQQQSSPHSHSQSSSPPQLPETQQDLPSDPGMNQRPSVATKVKNNKHHSQQQKQQHEPMVLNPHMPGRLKHSGSAYRHERAASLGSAAARPRATGGRFALSDFRLGKVLGSGGTATVIRAELISPLSSCQISSMSRRTAVANGHGTNSSWNSNNSPHPKDLERKKKKKGSGHNRTQSARIVSDADIVGHTRGSDGAGGGIHELLASPSCPDSLPHPHTQEYALKVISKKALSKRAMHYLTREIMIHRAVQCHRNVVSLHDVFEDSVSIYLVEEFVRGGDLYSVLKRERNGLAELPALLVVAQVLDALAFMHQHGFAHRDIKPENIMFAERPVFDPYGGGGAGGVGVVKLIDFGLACARDPKAPVRERTSAEKCGTIRYAAPEVISEGCYIPELADVWSVGVVLYSAIAHRNPFAGKTEKEVLSQMQVGDLHFDDDAAWNNVSSETKRLISHMLQRRATDRPSAAQALAAVNAIVKQLKARQVSCNNTAHAQQAWRRKEREGRHDDHHHSSSRSSSSSRDEQLAQADTEPGGDCSGNSDNASSTGAGGGGGGKSSTTTGSNGGGGGGGNLLEGLLALFSGQSGQQQDEQD